MPCRCCFAYVSCRSVSFANFFSLLKLSLNPGINKQVSISLDNNNFILPHTVLSCISILCPRVYGITCDYSIISVIHALSVGFLKQKQGVLISSHHIFITLTCHGAGCCCAVVPTVQVHVLKYLKLYS